MQKGRHPAALFVQIAALADKIRAAIGQGIPAVGKFANN